MCYKFDFTRLVNAKDDLPKGLDWDEKAGIVVVIGVVLGMAYSFWLELQEESLHVTVERSKVKKKDRYETIEEPKAKLKAKKEPNPPSTDIKRDNSIGDLKRAKKQS